MKTLSTVPTAALTALLVACSGTVEIGSGDGLLSADAGADGSRPAPSAPEPSTDSDRDAGPTRDAEVPEPEAGAEGSVTVLLTHSRSADGLPPYGATTFTTQGGTIDPDPACAIREVGACTVQQKMCGPLPGTQTLVGTPTILSFTGAAFPSTMNLHVTIPGGPAQFGSFDPWWTDGGQAVGISAQATSESPAFTANVETPSDLTITLPTHAVAAAALRIPFTRNGAAGGTARLQVNRLDAGGSAGPFVFCTATPDAGEVTVPAELMTALGAGTLQAVVTTQSISKSRVAGYDVVVNVADTIATEQISVP